jgi:Family of unknown function (DUF6088)
MSIQQQLNQYISHLPAGSPLLVRDIIGIGGRDAVDQALHRMVKAGTLVRVGRGLYARPQHHPVLGEIPISVQDIVNAYLKGSGARAQIAGAAALNLLGLSDQVPVGTHFYTDGATHRITRGQQTILLQHVNPKVLVCAGTEAAPVLSALYSVGKHGANEAFSAALTAKITPSMKQVLLPALPYMIGWMHDLLTPITRRDKEMNA